MANGSSEMVCKQKWQVKFPGGILIEKIYYFLQIFLFADWNVEVIVGAWVTLCDQAVEKQDEQDRRA